MLGRYNDYFLSKSLSPNNLKVESFASTELETEYKYLLVVKQKIADILEQPHLAESDRKYCTQTLEDIKLFTDYLSAQMMTIVSLEPQATIQDVIEFQKELLPHLSSYRANEQNKINELLFTLDKTSLNEVKIYCPMHLKVKNLRLHKKFAKQF